MAHWHHFPPEILSSLEGLDPFTKCGGGNFLNMWKVPGISSWGF